MIYKTIVLNLLQEWPRLHAQLCRERLLLPAVELFSRELQARHENWMDHLATRKPGRSAAQTASKALELAVQDLRDRLPNESTPSGSEELSLDEAIGYVRWHMSNA